MKPYYEDAKGGITIYHGDCREVMGAVVADAVVTDPPYGINAARTRNSQRWGWRDYGIDGWDSEPPDPTTIGMCVSIAKRAVLWGGNYFVGLPFVARGKWLVWDKCQTDFSLADCELAWCSWAGAIRRISYSRSAALRDGKSHPTQKPEAVMRWTIQQLDGGETDNQTILDPFMGSGTTLRAAKDLGRKAIGIEIEERYCEIAAKRLSQEVLFAPTTTKENIACQDSALV